LDSAFTGFKQQSNNWPHLIYEHLHRFSRYLKIIDRDQNVTENLSSFVIFAHLKFLVHENEKAQLSRIQSQNSVQFLLTGYRRMPNLMSRAVS